MLKISTFQVGKLIFIKNVWIFCGTYECYNLVRFNEIELLRFLKLKRYITIDQTKKRE